MRILVLLAVASAGLSACDPSTAPKSEVDLPDEHAETYTGQVFELTPNEREDLTRKADAGDLGAAKKLWGFYAFTGGEGDPNIDEPHDKAQAARWRARMKELGADGGDTER